MRQLEFTKPEGWTHVQGTEYALNKAREAVIENKPAWIHPRWNESSLDEEAITVFLRLNEEQLPHEWKGRFARSVGGVTLDGVEGWLWLYTPPFTQPPY